MLPDHLEPQLLSAAKAPPEGDGWLHEVKYDGYRLLCRMEHGRARLFTRRGSDWTGKLAKVAAAVERLGTGDAWLDGELVALRPDGRPDFEALHRAMAGRGGVRLAYQVFDVPYAAGRSLLEHGVLARKRVAEELVRGRCAEGIVRYTDHLVGSGPELLAHARAAGLEGIVCKRAGSRYRPGTRSRDWLKVKAFHRYVFRVAGFTSDGLQLADEAGAVVGSVYGGRTRTAPGDHVEVKALRWEPGRKLRHAVLLP
ncbi:MAG TPA: hypothetical protein VFQ45_19380 [Longimicrobium sp.]|nr:hypothetical protein [Longimicrobium sp.]